MEVPGPPQRVVASTGVAPSEPRGRRQRGISLRPSALARAIATHDGSCDPECALALSRWATVVVGAHYAELNARLRHFFGTTDAAFSPPAAPRGPPGADDGGDASDGIGDPNVACSDLCTLLASAEYTLLPPRLYAAALGASYYFFVPNGTEWSKLDGTVLPPLYSAMSAAGAPIMRGADSSYVESTGETPTYLQHLLVTVRGQHLEERTERFLDRKVDLIILLMWFGIAWVVGAAVALVAGPPKGAAVAAWMRDLIDGVLPGSEPNEVVADTDVAAATPRRHSGGDGRPTHRAAPPGHAEVISPLRAIVAGSQSQPGLCAGRVTVDEAILRDGLFRNFLGHSTAREPCFDDVVVVYREKDQPPVALAGGVEAAIPPSAAPPPPSPWRLGAYRNVPLADLEMVLPHKTLGMLPVDTLRTVAGAAALFICLYFTLAEAVSPSSSAGAEGPDATVIGAAIDAVQEEVSVWMHFAVAMTIAATIAGRLVALVFSYLTTQTAYLAEIQQWLLLRRVANGRDVVSKIADEVQQQDVAEIVLGMYALCAVYAKAGSDGATPVAIREKAEAVLNGAAAGSALHGTPSVEFDVDDALEKLVTVGLATQRSHPSCGTAFAPTVGYVDLKDWVMQQPASTLFDVRLRGGTQ